MMTERSFCEILNALSFNDWKFRLFYVGDKPHLQIIAEGPSNTDPSVTYRWSGRKWPLSEHMTKSEVVQTAFKAVLVAVEHEAREQFLYRGRPIFGPHFDVDMLHDLCGQDGHDDVRTDAVPK